MSDIVIKVENLGKQYRLGKVGTGSIGEDLNKWWHHVRGKENPYLKIGDVNDRTKTGGSDYVWAIKDINFEVKQGEVLGIIGRNGAGKSTLLKILSRVTSPSIGEVMAKGRIASLLEVGTGFHPDLSGRENIFLNGAILGMTKTEIKNKFDEIVDFSGVERYIDTPVKRYSSGMYVRLAFAVAAHLEPEILILDEVLAVGDTEFQKKCIGKMKDVSGQGRTVLFVSHNMAAVKNICTQGIMLKNGNIFKQGKVEDIIPEYLSNSTNTDLCGELIFELNQKPFQINSIKITNSIGEIISKPISLLDDYFVNVKYSFKEEVKKCNLTLIIKNNMGELIWFLDRVDFHKEHFVAEVGSYEAKIKIPNPLLKEGEYFLTLGLSDIQSGINDHKFDLIKFEINNVNSLRQVRQGLLFIPTKWEMNKMLN